jgi:hypothetical protein
VHRFGVIQTFRGDGRPSVWQLLFNEGLCPIKGSGLLKKAQERGAEMVFSSGSAKLAASTKWTLSTGPVVISSAS